MQTDNIYSYFDEFYELKLETHNKSNIIIDFGYNFTKAYTVKRTLKYANNYGLCDWIYFNVKI